MANVTVFVDDGVLGNLPEVCAVTGIPTGDKLTFRKQVGGSTGLGVAWLLVLAGPLGWLGIAAMALFRRGAEYLTVTLPYSENVQLRRVQAEKAQLKAMVVMVVALVLAFVAFVQESYGSDLLALGLAAIGVGALVTMVMCARRIHHLSVQLTLDASRRWLTLWGVNPEFVLAVERRTSRMAEQPES